LIYAAEDSAIRALVLTGTGQKAFVAGGDINELARQNPLEGKRFGLIGQEVLRRLEKLGKPSIAAINGFALGGGCELALACTFRIASMTARLGLPEVKLGIIPGLGCTQRLARLCRKGVALEMILTGKMISAEEALRVGLVSQVVDPAELIATAEKIAQKTVANGPVAMKFAIDAIECGQATPQKKGLFLESSLSGLVCATEDMREGTRAFQEKRPPRFSGR
jgi:enoyl-CoA hydratase